MKFDPQHYHRRSIRLRGYNYRVTGAYFVTVCTAQKRPVFGAVKNGCVCLHPYGAMAWDCWLALPHHFTHLSLDAFIVMPNHFHGIFVFVEDASSNGEEARFGASQAGSLGLIVGQMKMRVTQRINAHRAARNWPPVRVWQRNFHERILRDETEWQKARRYILDNPLHWETDEHHPAT